MSDPTRTYSDGESLDDLVARLQQTQLLTAEQIATVRSAPNGIAAAQRLIEAGLITRWQATELQTGRSSFLLGKYKLLEKLGEGGMGTVYQAEQQGGMGRVVAIKVMSPKVLNNPDAVQRFLREVRAAAALNHRNIVTAYDADSDGGTYFLVMEYVEGRDLSDWIDDFGRLPIEWTCECIRQAALGLEHAHQRQLIHRDIKPSNLLAIADDTSGRPLVKIMDFGLARFSSDDGEQTDLTNTGQVMGTIDYIAPEQARNTKDATIRSDIFSLGCTLFKMLTGESAYTGQSVTEKLIARTSDDALRVQSLRADVPDELDVVIAKMLARRPEDRYQTPQQVADALLPYCPPADSDSSATLNSETTEVAMGRFIGQLSSQADDTDAATLTLGYPPAAPVEEVQGKPGRRSYVTIVGLCLAALAGVAVLVLVFALNASATTYRVLVLVDQPSATVIVDGAESYETPAVREPLELQLTAGSHDVMARKQGFAVQQQTIIVSADSNKIKFDLAQSSQPATVPTTNVNLPPSRTQVEKFDLIVPGTNSHSVAELSDVRLVITDQHGKVSTYDRNLTYDEDGYVAYFNGGIRQVLLWPEAEAGNLKIGNFVGETVTYRPSQMQIQPAATRDAGTILRDRLSRPGQGDDHQ